METALPGFPVATKNRCISLLLLFVGSNQALKAKEKRMRKKGKNCHPHHFLQQIQMTWTPKTKAYFGFHNIVGVLEQKDTLLLGCKSNPDDIQVQEPLMDIPQTTP
jgi:hypothetical protein